jgi:hypothetical protein
VTIDTNGYVRNPAQDLLTDAALGRLEQEVDKSLDQRLRV